MQGSTSVEDFAVGSAAWHCGKHSLRVSYLTERIFVFSSSFAIHF
jgi:hypothetical protein